MIGGFLGSWRLKRVPPPGPICAVIVPWWASATCFTMARPSPDPGRVRAFGAVEPVEDVREVGRVDPPHDVGRRRRLGKEGLCDRSVCDVGD